MLQPSATETPTLRPYQQEAHDAILESLAGKDSTLLIKPTGCGKTVTLAAVAKSWKEAGKGVVLAIAHRREIVEQLASALEQVGLHVEIEMGESRASGEAGLFGRPDAVVASVQSMAHRLRYFPQDSISLLIIDEAHHAVLKSQYHAVREHFSQAKLLGVTATPDRLDKRGMGGLFESVAYTYEIRDAIDAGYLVPVRQQVVHVEEMDLSQIRKVAGDLNEGQLDELMREEGMLRAIAEPAVKIVGDRQGIFFAVTVAHAHALARTINEYAGSGSAVALDGSSPPEQRAEVLERYRCGDVQHLVNCALFTEGIDLPMASAIVMARFTASRALYTQMAGRGLRLHPGKTDCLLIDFAGNAGKHSLISAPMVLRPDIGPEEAARVGELSGGQVALHDAVDQVAEESRVAALRERMAKLKVSYRVQDVDPFAALGLDARPGTTSLKPTEPQVRALDRFRVPMEEIEKLDRRQATRLLEELIQSAKAKLATYKQRRFFVARGLDPKGVTFEAASQVMNLVAQNHWKVPDSVFEQYGAAS